MYFSLLGNIGLFNSCVWCMWNRPALAFFLCQGHRRQQTLPLLIGRCLRSGKGSDNPSTLMDLPVYSLTPFFFPANFSFACWVVSLWIKWKETKGKAHAANKAWLCSWPLSTGFSTYQVHHRRTDSLWHFLHLLMKSIFYTCSNLEEKWDYSNHLTYNALLFVVDLNAQPQAPDVLRFQTPVSDFSCLGTHPRALSRVIQTGQMPKCFALSNVKPERHKETRSKCPSTEITGVSGLKPSSLPNSLLRPRKL